MSGVRLVEGFRGTIRNRRSPAEVPAGLPGFVRVQILERVAQAKLQLPARKNVIRHKGIRFPIGDR